MYFLVGERTKEKKKKKKVNGWEITQLLLTHITLRGRWHDDVSNNMTKEHILPSGDNIRIAQNARALLMSS
jgi:hypothetical protein